MVMKRKRVLLMEKDQQKEMNLKIKIQNEEE
jgi:hypothetical protein